MNAITDFRSYWAASDGRQQSWTALNAALLSLGADRGASGPEVDLALGDDPGTAARAINAEAVANPTGEHP